MTIDEAARKPPDWDQLFDVGRLPGTGPRLWGEAVEQQLVAVVQLNRGHRRHHAWGPTPKPEDPNVPSVLDRLHVHAYYLVMAIKRVLRFTSSLAKATQDQRLYALRNDYVRKFSSFEIIRDYYEHLDAYTLGEGKHQRGDAPRIAAPIAPLLKSSWHTDDVIVDLGGESLNLTAAGWSAKELAETAEGIYEEHIERSLPKEDAPPQDGRVRTLYLVKAPTSQLGSNEEGYMVITTRLRHVGTRLATPEEIARYRERGELDESELPPLID